MTFEDQLAHSERGDEIIYHKGYHCVDLNGRKIPPAKAAWQAYERGDVLLYQRRIAPGLLHYCAKVLV
jgi:hypothetical protein